MLVDVWCTVRLRVCDLCIVHVFVVMGGGVVSGGCFWWVCVGEVWRWPFYSEEFVRLGGSKFFCKKS